MDAGRSCNQGVSCTTCLEDGLKFKPLKRHLIASHAMTPSQCRANWAFPQTIPLWHLTAHQTL
ncbi:MAG: MucR family transcriptional regulator [Pseudorhizobium sp.]